MSTNPIPGVTVQDLAKTLMQSFDANKDGQINTDEFGSFLGKLLSGVNSSAAAYPINSVGSVMCLVKKTGPRLGGPPRAPARPVRLPPAIGELADDADLHVVDDQGEAIRIADVQEPVGDLKVAVVLHGVNRRPCSCGRRARQRRPRL